jgi:hypothetical protein
MVLSLIGAAGARAETLTVIEPAYAGDADPTYVADLAPPVVAEPAPYAPTIVAPAPYVREPYVTETAVAPAVTPRYVYQAPAIDAPVVVVEQGYAAESTPVIVQRPRRVIVERSPAWVEPPRAYERRRLAPLPSRRIEARYAAPNSCVLDANGFERCY